MLNNVAATQEVLTYLIIGVSAFTLGGIVGGLVQSLHHEFQQLKQQRKQQHQLHHLHQSQQMEIPATTHEVQQAHVHEHVMVHDSANIAPDVVQDVPEITPAMDTEMEQINTTAQTLVASLSRSDSSAVETNQVVDTTLVSVKSTKTKKTRKASATKAARQDQQLTADLPDVLTIRELYAEAKLHGIKNYKSLKKHELIAALYTKAA